MGSGWIGRRVARKEDHRLLTGRGRFTDDLAGPGAARAAIVRSPHPHARILDVDASAARAMDGVLAVLAGRDVEGRIGPVPTLARTPPFARLNRDGSPMPDPCQPVLATTRVRYAGEPVAMVVAETGARALDAAEAVAVEYEPLPAATTWAQVRAPDTPVWDDVPGNVTFDREQGDRAATEAAFSAAAHVVETTLVNNRVTPVFLEPRSAFASFDPGSGTWTLTLGCQTAHGMRANLAGMLGVAPERLRVVVPDMGGGFGARGTPYPEFALLLAAARRTGRTVHWTATRAESFLADAQSRDHLLHGALAVDAEGRFTAMRALVEWRHGAYVTPRGFATMTDYLIPTMGGSYRIPTGWIEMRGYSSNTTPQAAYRGIGRVESGYLAESLVDAAAAATGIDRVELRRRNLVAPHDMPWTAPGGFVYRGADLRANLDRAVAAVDMAGFAARRAASAARGRLRGIAATPYVENDGGAPADYAKVEAHPDGTVTVLAGTQSFGMGHETVYAQIAADRLGIDFEAVRFVDGDTARVKEGWGSHGSRSMRIGGTACVLGADAMIERGRALAAEMLEAAGGDVGEMPGAAGDDAGGMPEAAGGDAGELPGATGDNVGCDAGDLPEAAGHDVGYDAGVFAVKGTNRSVTLAEVAAFAAGRGEVLSGEHRFTTGRGSLGNGAAACEVEIDPDTGAVAVVRHVIVCDTGRTINPMLAEGQLHGGAAQGLGQAVLERVVHDPETGQNLSGSLMDYAIPRADDLPAFEVVLTEVAETDNPLGVKGIGEGPTTGAPPALMGAVRDALSVLGPPAIDMPVTPENVWRAIRAARARPLDSASRT